MIPLEISDLGERFDEGLLQRVYEAIYLPAFPRLDEQENPAIWTARLRDPAANPRLTFLVASTRMNGSAALTPIALLVAEYYGDSGCVLVSYLAVAPSMQGQGVARHLFDVLAARIRSGRVSGGPLVHAVFAEVHGPQTSQLDEVMDPSLRLRILTKLGAVHIPIDYRQPALSPDQMPVDGLWLVAFPDCVVDPGALTRDRLRNFLSEFYRVMGSPDPLDDAQYQKTFASVDALDDARSSLRLQHVAVALQYLSCTALGEDARPPAPGDAGCASFESYEQDLLSHAFRAPPPVRSRCVADSAGRETLACTVRFPAVLRYRTEGADYALLRQGPLCLPATVSASRSDFIQSGRSVLHLVVHFDLPAGVYLGEYEILCLSKAWCAENDSETNVVCEPEFIVDAHVHTLATLAQRYFPEAILPGARPRGGCVQIVFPDIDSEVTDTPDRVSAGQLIEAINALQEKGAAPPDPLLNAPLKAIGGVLQNILDLKNVDVNELDDMLDGVNSARYAMTAIHRGTLLSLNIQDRLFTDKGDSIGISPYLLLPQAALLHNESLLFDAAGMLRNANALSGHRDNADVRRKLQKMRKKLMKMILKKRLELPGAPDWLIRTLVGFLWWNYRRRASAKPGKVRGLTAEFIAIADQAVQLGRVHHAHQRLVQWLEGEYLGNVFQYRSERWIFDEGSRDRGLDSLLQVAQRQMVELDALIEDGKSDSNEWFTTNLTVIGLAFTLYQVIPFSALTPDGGDKQAVGGTAILLQTLLGLVVILAVLGPRLPALIYRRALMHAGRRLAEKETRKKPVG